MLQKSPCRWDSLPKPMGILEWSWKGVRGGPLEKRSSNDAGSAARASAPWQSQGYGLRRQPEDVARFKAEVPVPRTTILACPSIFKFSKILGRTWRSLERPWEALGG